MKNERGAQSRLDCQVEVLPSAGDPLAPGERLIRYLVRAGYKLLTDPGVVIRRLRPRLRLRAKTASQVARRHTDAGRRAGVSLCLSPGELVEIKSMSEIRATLDEHGRFDGLGYMPSVMDRYCGGNYRVHRRIGRFFDERRGRLLQLRDVVILEGVYCEPPRDPRIVYSGCDRSCFLFWKEAWLRRPTEAPHVDG